MIKKSVVGEMIDGVKKAAGGISHAARDTAGGAASKKLHERIVPIPPIDTYSELPFARVETNHEATSAAPKRDVPRKAASKPTKKPPATRKKTKASTAKKQTKKKPAKKRKAR